MMIVETVEIVEIVEVVEVVEIVVAGFSRQQCGMTKVRVQLSSSNDI